MINDSELTDTITCLFVLLKLVDDKVFSNDMSIGGAVQYLKILIKKEL